MKRILLLTLLSLFCASLSAMQDMTIEAERLFAEALVDDPKAQAFADYIASNALNIDKIRAVKGNAESIGKYLATELNNAMALKETDKERRIQTIIYPIVKPFRSNPPEAVVLRGLIEDVRYDGAKIADLEAFLLTSNYNIDLITQYSMRSETLAMHLDFCKCISPIMHKAEALNAIAILRLDRINQFRTGKRNLLEELLVETRFDASRFDAFKAEYEKNSVNVDLVIMPDGSTIGEYLMYALRHDADYAGALKMAALVQPHRTNTYESCEILIGAYFRDEKRFGDLQSWFEKFPCDFDVASEPAGITFGKSFDELAAGQTLKDEDRKKVLRVLELGRPHRAKDMKAFRELFKKYEQDSSKFVDLKKWFDEHPFDIDKVAYDTAKPHGETVGQRVNWLNEANLTTLFKANRSTPSVPHMHSWFTPKKILCSALVFGAGYYYYRRSGQKSEQESKDVLPMTVVS